VASNPGINGGNPSGKPYGTLHAGIVMKGSGHWWEHSALVSGSCEDEQQPD
jgi:hypothetical protein